MPKRRLYGVVVSKSMKTAKIKVKRSMQHPLYGKITNRYKNYAAHDPNDKCNVGDEVEIIEHRPISKTKKWLVIYDEKKDVTI